MNSEPEEQPEFENFEESLDLLSRRHFCDESKQTVEEEQLLNIQQKNSGTQNK